MLTKLKELLFDGERRREGADRQRQLQLATAALLVEAAMMDGQVDATERQTVEDLLRHRFDLDEQAARQLLAEAEEHAADASQLYGFTKVIKDEFSAEERVNMMEMLWEVAYADGELHDYEANLARRVGGLLHVPDKESGLARQRVLERLGLVKD